MKSYEIPLTPIQQKLAVSLNGKRVNMTIRWHEGMTGCWHMDLDDVLTDAPLVYGLPMVTGINLLGQYGHLEIPCALVLSGPDMVDPTRDNLGTDVKLYMVTDD